MQAFTTVTGIAAPLPMINVDTDMIIPKQFLKTIKRTGLGANLFNDMRFNPDGSEKPDFVLNRPPYRDARILVAGANFACGSSREHAPWALLDFGISCVIAPSFADIFYNNSIKNGLLPVVLPEAEVERLMAAAQAGVALTVDLAAQRVTSPDSASVAFDIDPWHKHCLLNGLDDIGLTLQKETAIARFEEARSRQHPWL